MLIYESRKQVYEKFVCVNGPQLTRNGTEACYWEWNSNSNWVYAFYPYTL